jgi:hypothetical protein
MRYFKVISNGKILCTFLRPDSKHHEIMLRCDPRPSFPEYDPGFTSYPSPEYPEERRYGKMVEIYEAEATKIDPGLFEAWTSYEDLKRLELQKESAPAKKRKVVRESATVQEA